jgi:drug/metabolite transporter (DMT)-like permease
MVSESLGTRISLIGNLLAVLISVAFALATVIIRHYSNVRMTPACFLGTMVSAGVAALLCGTFAVSTADMALLFAFGALNLGLGMVLFATGARLVPAAIAALIGTTEPVLGPLWVWFIHAEVPSRATLVGGSIVVLALVVHLIWQYQYQRKAVASVR